MRRRVLSLTLAVLCAGLMAASDAQACCHKKTKCAEPAPTPAPAPVVECPPPAPIKGCGHKHHKLKLCGLHLHKHKGCKSAPAC